MKPSISGVRSMSETRVSDLFLSEKEITQIFTKAKYLNTNTTEK